MSRCFPFPPPGYEKKTRTDDVDLPKKEKHKEKKHKKDKKDKEKKDKEKKEKREKEGRDKKSKDKDKKEKKREKKKDKDKDKDKDKGRDRDTSKTSTADGTGLPGQAEGLNAGKLQKEIKPDKKDAFVDNKIIKQYTGNNGEMAREINHQAKENKDSKFLLEFERRIKDDNGAASNQLVQKFTNADHRKDEGTIRLLARNSGTLHDDSEKLKDKRFDAKKIEGKGINAQVRPFENATVQNHAGNFHPNSDRGFNAKKIEGKAINAEVRPFGNATVQNHAGNLHPNADRGFDAKKIEGKGINAEVRPFRNATVQNHAGNLHPNADRGFDAKKIEGKGINAEVRPFGNATVQNHAGNFHPKADGMPKFLGKYIDRNSEATVGGKEKIDEKKDKTVGGNEKINEKKEEGKEKVKEKKEEGKEKDKKKKDDKRGEKRKNKEEKKGHGKDKDRDKKKEKTKGHTEVKTTEQNKLKESNNVGPIHSNSFTRISKNSHENSVGIESNNVGPIHSNSFTQISKNSHENSVGVENSKKRKEIDSNGVPHANENWPSKLPRSSSSHPFTENGRILEPCKMSIPNASDRPEVAVSSAKIENTECKINGFIEAQPLAVPSNKTHATTMPAVPLIEASSKSPHPDTKYLNHIYSVPKVEWSALDDQEWLFDNSISQERKPMVTSEAGETPQVWAEVVHLEPADVFALPYVIPY
ncbi:uncharacterized protein LOC131603437 isoform X2 [Vicia villosa]|uniref:uncharacterized protein LOC131603437 isoform X2 n=1 Tax=Vicia villosa TaxID=3911 RepID=UPI00273B8222|nr:uncharacterized protein LOC131603437 isoform X2 [Vicia villosa]